MASIRPLIRHLVVSCVFAIFWVTARAQDDATQLLRIESWSPQASAGPAVRIGTSLTMDCCSKYSRLGNAVKNGYLLFFEWLNTKRGGIQIGGVSRPAELVLVGDNSNTTRVRSITSELINSQGINLFLGPYSSTLTKHAAEIVQSAGGVLVAPASSSTSVFKDRPNVFGTLTPNTRFLDTTFAALSGLVASVSFVQEDVGFTKGVCGSVERLATTNGMTLLGSFTIAENADEASVSSVVDALISDPPELIVTCVYDTVCQRLLTAAKQQGLQPKAWVTTICVTSSEFIPQLGNVGRFILGVTPWIPTLPLSATGSWSASTFASAYRDRFKLEPPYQAASAWAAAEALVMAIEAAGTTDAGQVAESLRGLNLRTLFGRVAFDQEGQSLNEFKVVQFSSDSVVPLLVAPNAESRNPLLHPFPGWSERLCLLGEKRQDLASTAEKAYGYISEDASNISCAPCASNLLARYTIDNQSSATNISRPRYLGAWVCKSCPEGTMPVVVAGKNACFKMCPAGEVPKQIGDSAECEACPAGTFQIGGSCKECEQGRFANASGLTTCPQCQAGSYTNTTRSSSCTPCPPGSSSPNDGGRICRVCARGQFAANSGSVDCDLCSAGTVATGEGSLNCSTCQPGEFSEWGARRCLDCDPGTYQDEAKQSQCKFCGEGAVCDEPGLTKPENNEGWYMTAENKLLTCITPRECLEGEMCREGQAGHLCRLCLPGYFRGMTSSTCAKCPPVIPNLGLSLIIVVVLVGMIIIITKMVVSAVNKPKLVHPVLLKLIVNYTSTMTVVCVTMVTLLEQRRELIGDDVIEVLLQLASFLNSGDGLGSPESPLWSPACLLQRSLSAEEEASMARLASARHSEYFSDHLAADREILEEFHQGNELICAILWLLLVLATCILVVTVALLHLRRTLKSQKQFLTRAVAFYEAIRMDGFEHAKREGAHAAAWPSFVHAYKRRLLDLFRLVDYAEIMYTDPPGSFPWGIFISQCRSLVIVSLFVLYGTVLRQVLRPLNCHVLGPDDAWRQKSAATIECYKTSDPLFVLSFLAGLSIGVIVPLRGYYVLYSQRYKLQDEAVNLSWGVLYNGYEPNFWWWEFLVFFRKSCCTLISVIHTGGAQSQALALLTIAIFFTSAHLFCKPFDRRGNDLLDTFERRHLFMWMLSCILMLGIHITDSVVVIIISVVVIMVCHAAMLIWSVRVTYHHLRMSYADKLLKKLEEEEGFSCIQKIVRFIVRQNVRMFRRQAYVCLHPIHSWASLHGTRGDQAKPPIIMTTEHAIQQLDRPLVISDVDIRTVEPKVKSAKHAQRRFFLQVISTALEHILVDMKLDVFGTSLFEFVVRAGFTLHVVHHSQDPIENSKQTADDAETEELMEPEAVVVERASKKGDMLALLDSAIEKTVAEQMADAGASKDDIAGVYLEEQLRSKRAEQQAAAIPASVQLEEETMDQDELDEKAAQEMMVQEELLRKRLQHMVDQMFEPFNFKRGVSLEKMQLNLMELQRVPPYEMQVWLDLFESRWLMHKAQAGAQQFPGMTFTASGLMVPEEHKKPPAGDLIRVCEVVLVRILSESGRMIVKSTTMLDSLATHETHQYALPTVARTADEESQAAVLRLLKAELNLSDEHVRIMPIPEVFYDEEHDSPEFPGLPSVFRKQYAEARIETRDLSVLKSVGLPAETDFTKLHHNGRDTLFYSWWSEATCREKGVLPEVLHLSDIMKNFHKVNPIDGQWKKQDLQDLLTQHHVDTSKYGLDEAITLDGWVTQLSSGASFLMESFKNVQRNSAAQHAHEEEAAEGIANSEKPRKSVIKFHKTHAFMEGACFDVSVQTNESSFEGTDPLTLMNSKPEEVTENALLGAIEVKGEDESKTQKAAAHWAYLSLKYQDFQVGVRLNEVGHLVRSRNEKQMMDKRELQKREVELHAKNVLLEQDLEKQKKSFEEEMNRLLQDPAAHVAGHAANIQRSSQQFSKDVMDSMSPRDQSDLRGYASSSYRYGTDNRGTLQNGRYDHNHHHNVYEVGERDDGRSCTGVFDCLSIDEPDDRKENQRAQYRPVSGIPEEHRSNDMDIDSRLVAPTARPAAMPARSLYGRSQM